MSDPATDDRLLLLSPADNVLVARAPIAAGERIWLDGRQLTVGAALSMGHKLARRAIAAGDSVVKYGAVIGTATADIAPGAHVHLHNLRSNYTATYALDAPAGGTP
ncbi:MAG: hydrolase [Limimaricola sp.]|uniref:UxaA family hydrolase n=1 Tax=Limimaricola sp. TaxID=2211665 RepID=UPI001DBFFEA8|nr:UxaA family hydrolase [Limimaricola sp.]MBI1416760.1 hydrolase [Limimaricola sp.]